MVPLHNGFMTLLCNYDYDNGYFLWRNISSNDLLHNKIIAPSKQEFCLSGDVFPPKGTYSLLSKMTFLYKTGTN